MGTPRSPKSIDLFCDDMRREPLLTSEEEIHLAKILHETPYENVLVQPHTLPPAVDYFSQVAERNPRVKEGYDQTNLSDVEAIRQAYHELKLTSGFTALIAIYFTFDNSEHPVSPPLWAQEWDIMFLGRSKYKRTNKLSHFSHETIEYLAQESHATELATAYQTVYAQVYPAFKRFVDGNYRLVVKLASNYRKKHKISESLAAETINAGNDGLMRVVAKFDYTKGYKFSTYASWYIRQRIQRHMNQYFRTIKTTVHHEEEIRKLLMIKGDLEQKRGRAVTETELKDHVVSEGIFTEEYFNKLTGIRQLQFQESTDQPFSEESPELYPTYCDDGSKTPEEISLETQMTEFVSEIISRLSPIQKHVIIQRYGLFGNPDHTLSEIAEDLGYSRERIRQIQVKAQKKLERILLSHRYGWLTLESFLK